ncbi:Mitochondrial pyruvate carrier 2 [Balamuthia mandrillaris]
MATTAARWKSLWNHPAGPRTIHFWAPAFKWSLVIAGIADLKRPAEKISTPQSTALAATGLIWSRYSTQITPVNYSLLSVNLFVALTGLYQLARKLRWYSEQRKLTDISKP